ncbi:MAG: hypothetical protein JWM99_4410 [Verrucomicrobiales bacterium]|nr:hypothetical protein [Verrucomicrobiales bacterium]
MIKSGSALALGVFLLTGCHKNLEGERTETSSSATPISSAATSGELKAAANLVQAGALDEAAARLIKIRASASSFTPHEAAQFRETMATAYSRALEAAQKGDPKAQAAVQLLRVAGPK